MRQSLVCICPACDIEMINIGNNDFRHFICTECGRATLRVCDSMITQKELYENYKVEKAQYIKEMSLGK